jgi:alpha-L-arabinofuranosidase
MNRFTLTAGLFAFLLPMSLCSAAEPVTLTVECSQSGHALNPGMWGIFFEDINFGGDGGLYAELVKNRSFEFQEPLMGWRTLGPAGGVEVRDDQPFSRVQPRYVRVKNEAGIENEGFRGLGVHANESYDFTVAARGTVPASTLVVELVAADGKVLASGHAGDLTTEWQPKAVTLTPTTTDPKASLRVSVKGGGPVDLDMVSLFPQKTWKNQAGGLRADLMQWLVDLKPGFLRFPGGCNVEGDVLENRYQWKTTIGPIAERKMIVNRWNSNGIKSHPAPDYFQTFGLGFYEFFQICEEIGAEPLPVVNCGMACQFNSSELAPLDQLGSYIQDALDLIEFANGPVTSTWGAKRAELGHPEPFGMKMIGLGNEQWGQPYFDRYVIFEKALKDKYPEIKIVSSAGPSSDNKYFHFAWPKLRELKADIVDEHSYAKPEWFYNSANRYDKYDREGPKVFFGEYAAQSDKPVSDLNQNNLECAVAEAATMTGLERNGDIVRMASYAPLFAHVDAWQWKPDLIWFDNLTSYGTVNYYVQKMFSNHAGDVIVPARLDGVGSSKLFASATRANSSGELILKIVNGESTPVTVGLNLAGADKVAPSVKVSTLTSGSPLDENNFATPAKILPQDSVVEVSAPQFDQVFPAKSLTVLRFKCNP